MPSVPSLLNAVNIRDEIGAGLLLPKEGTMSFRVFTSVTILLPPSFQPASQPFQFYPDQASGNHHPAAKAPCGFFLARQSHPMLP
ncbi:hypothetical protein QR685DRAFT_573851 [Neurospora intermedia]|uniref:Uncharacterized protein n=1 Tax=Neurospora intermedia TaxID=5142 RepID=A0ABR3DA08_NEUIN